MVNDNSILNKIFTQNGMKAWLDNKESAFTKNLLKVLEVNM